MKATVVTTIDRTVVSVPATVGAASAGQAVSAAQQDRERRMFGCTAAALDEALAGKSPQDIVMYAMSTLSSAQELIRSTEYEGTVEWAVADQDASTIRYLINAAKYAIDKAVPR